MSVLINGFPLPNNCGACPLRLAWCRERIYMVTRPERCPLVSFPPHGRLIDADALIERIEFEVRHYVVKDEFGKGRVAAWNNVIRAIREYAPTIITADPPVMYYPQVHGITPTVIAEEVYDEYTDTAGNRHWTGTHSGKHIIPASEDGE